MPDPNIRRRSFSAFDRIVLCGAAVNVAVVAVLLGYWLSH